jgi:hypothetical protein
MRAFNSVCVCITFADTISLHQGEQPKLALAQRGGLLLSTATDMLATSQSLFFEDITATQQSLLSTSQTDLLTTTQYLPEPPPVLLISPSFCASSQGSPVLLLPFCCRLQACMALRQPIFLPAHVIVSFS